MSKKQKSFRKALLNSKQPAKLARLGFMPFFSQAYTPKQLLKQNPSRVSANLSKRGAKKQTRYKSEGKKRKVNARR
jgi:hypothetical protein